MSDKFSTEVRSRIMSRIKGRNTKPELKVRSFLHRAGLRFRLHKKGLPGKPDIVLPKYKTVIFVQGCFWHQHPGCKHSGIPLSNISYWKPKLNRTIERDKKNQEKLSHSGWHVTVLWECEITEGSLLKLVEEVKRADEETAE